MGTLYHVHIICNGDNPLAKVHGLSPCTCSQSTQGQSYVVSFMPRLHLPWASNDLYVYDFLYDFSGIVGGYKLRIKCVCLHGLPSPFVLSFGTRPYRDYLNTLCYDYFFDN